MIQLVMNIDEEDYRKIKDGRGSVKVMRDAIIHAVPLSWALEVVMQRYREDIDKVEKEVGYRIESNKEEHCPSSRMTNK